MSIIKQRIEQEAKVWEQLGRKDPIKELMLARGEEFAYDHKFKDYEKQPYGECFSNALHLALRVPAWSYCEGLALSGKGKHILLIEHAWVCTAKGVVIDNTWDRHKDNLYFGIRFDAEAVMRHVVKKGTYGLYTRSHCYDMKLIEKLMKGKKL